MDEITFNNQTLKVKQELLFYTAAQKESKLRPSGAYIFRPDSNEAAVFTSKIVSNGSFRGDLVDEFYQKFDDSIWQTIRAYKNESYIEFDWMVGPLNLS